MSSERYDVIIVGTGAGGGTLLWRLAPTGLKILVLERGEFLPRERENWDAALVAKGRYQARDAWYDKHDRPFRPYQHYWVGGNTKMYGAALLRLRESDFGEVRHWGGISPAWPIGYDIFEPYYTRAEELYSVHGTRGADPTEPPASKPFPHAPLPFEPRMQRLYEDLQRIGLRPAPVPLGVRLSEKRHPEAPVVLSSFDGFPDPTEVKADSHVVCVKPALEYPNVTLLTGAFVKRLETDASGRSVDRVVVEREGETLAFRADLVAISAGAVNSAALLLRSSSDKHPRGLANGSDHVGRNYMAHNNGTFIAISDEPNPSLFQKAFGIFDFYHRADDSDLPLGSAQLMGKMDTEWLWSLAHEKVPGRTGAELSTHAIEFFLTAEDLPDPNNRVSLRPDGSIRLSYTENNMEAYRRLHRKMAEVLSRCGCPGHAKCDQVYVGDRLDIGGTSHQNGTLRFGIDPRTSVLDLNCKAHELDNLYAVDASFFPSCGAVNPSLTIIANALRVGDHLAERMYR